MERRLNSGGIEPDRWGGAAVGRDEDFDQGSEGAAVGAVVDAVAEVGFDEFADPVFTIELRLRSTYGYAQAFTRRPQSFGF